jgi:hypothetical protein
MIRTVGRVTLLGVFVLGCVIAACNGSLQQTCVTGQSIACAGTNGCAGSQTCGADNQYGACGCSPQSDAGPTPDAGGSDVAQTDGISTDGVALDSPAPCTGTPPTEDAGTGYISSPAVTTTTLSGGYTLHMELNAFANYGVSDDKADILYTNDIGAWTFTIPATPIKSATIAASLVATDGTTTPAGNFTYELWSGDCESDTPKSLPHGLPSSRTGSRSTSPRFHKRAARSPSRSSTRRTRRPRIG